MDTLFYDGQCPLCAGEIAQLRKTRGESLNIVDVHDLIEGTSSLSDGLPASVSASAPSKDQLLRVLHLRRADGVWLTSADANVAAWEGTKHGRILSALRWPILRHAVDLVYTLWARWRYRRLYGNQFDEARHAPQQH
ncbi:DUF393 domain-containing protein [Congregibacter brevis]|uniref:DUF393 domain-containing protein n=1 Tax=Congregibacter brevis TaxID=3081201 RepID=A0ABZ0IK19_9GAMM|nr:DUF393 domain-containing protein [Congregibacter sp. IMCC45268]